MCHFNEIPFLRKPEEIAAILKKELAANSGKDKHSVIRQTLLSMGVKSQDLSILITNAAPFL